MAHLRHGERDSVVDTALDAMDAEQLRALIRALIPWLDDATQARLMNEVVDRAARASSDWAPATPSDQRVDEIEAFVAAAASPEISASTVPLSTTTSKVASANGASVVASASTSSTWHDSERSFTLRRAAAAQSTPTRRPA